MAAITGVDRDPFILELLRVLGLEADRVRGFELRCFVGEAVQVTVVEYAHPKPPDDEFRYFGEFESKRYVLVLSDDEGKV